MAIYDANYDGHSLTPSQPLDLPAGSQVQFILLRPTTRRRPLAELAKLLEGVSSSGDLPPDYATQLDHYLYGTPKHDEP